jgi:superoxide reductase
MKNTKLNQNSLMEAIREFNKYRIPEIKADLACFEDKAFYIKFTGTFCETCGFYDYFDDFRILLEDDYGSETKITEIEEIHRGALVKFQKVELYE